MTCFRKLSNHWKWINILMNLPDLVWLHPSLGRPLHRRPQDLRLWRGFLPCQRQQQFGLKQTRLLISLSTFLNLFIPWSQISANQEYYKLRTAKVFDSVLILTQAFTHVTEVGGEGQDGHDFAGHGNVEAKMNLKKTIWNKQSQSQIFDEILQLTIIIIFKKLLCN